MREIAVIQLGQCGNQIGVQFWEDITQEHGIGLDGKFRGNSDVQLERINVYFDERPKATYTPRAVLIDLDKTGLDNISKKPVGRIFSPDSFISGDNGTGNNWARGFYTGGLGLADESIDLVRQRVEACDQLQGFQLIHALGGGTGSGMGCLLMSRIRDEFPGKIMNTFSVLPSPRVSDSVVDPYNSVLSLHRMIDDSDETVCLDNEALHRICTKTLKLTDPEYSDLNQLVSKAISGVTACFRFPGQLNADLRKLRVNLVPYPRLHFFCPGSTPLTSRIGQVYRAANVAGLVRQMFESQSLMTECDPKRGRYLAVGAVFRGPVSTREVDRALKKADPPFVNFITNGVTTAICDVPPPGMTLSSTFLANTSSVHEVLKRLVKLHSMMFKKKAFLHWYLGEGMQEGDFVEAANSLNDLISEYLQYQQKENSVRN